MCGILGGWLDGTLDRRAISAALDAIRHRGPDDEGLCQDGPVFVGMRRLSIIDLEGGHQPISNEDGSVTIVFNGEVYNYRELATKLRQAGHTFRTESDTETIVHLYEEKGLRCVDELRGMFTFAIWDRRNRRLLVARDRFGKKPFYYWLGNDGRFLFASELKALLPLLDEIEVSLDIDEQSVYDYLSLLCVPQPQTIYRGVRALGPGCVATFDGNGFREQQYWTPALQPKNKLSYAETLERTRQLIGDSVRLRLRSDVPLGVFLSGGIDSSIVAAEAAREVGSSLQTFTIGSKDPRFDESEVAKRTAHFLQVRNTVLEVNAPPLETLQFLVRHYDQPFADPSAIPSLHVARMAAEHVTVVLNGDGGDELFGGYRRHLAAHLFSRVRLVEKLTGRHLAALLQGLALRRRSSFGFIARFLRGFGQPSATRFLTWTMDAMQEQDKRAHWRMGEVRPTEELLDAIVPGRLRGLDEQLYRDVTVTLLSALLVKMDMATMAASLEARSPLLDHVLAEFAMTIRPSYLLRGRRTKAVLRDAYRDILPTEVLTAAKRGFEVPLDTWLGGELKPLLHDTVLSSGARVANYLDVSFVRRVVDREVLRDRNWGYLVYSLLVLELWLRNAEERRRMPVTAKSERPPAFAGVE